MYKYICKKCGKKFTTQNKNKIYCSDECRKSVLRKKLSGNQKDLTGQKFGRLTAIYSKNVNKRYKWLCQCDCGNQVWVNTASLINGHTQSCGCLSRERASKNNSKYFAEYREKNFIHNTSIAKLKSRINTNNNSGTKGVYYHKSTKKWVAKLTFQKKTYCKEFLKKEDAIKYRKYLEDKYFNSFLESINKLD